MCVNPFFKGDFPYGCGQCKHCRINRKRLWTHRMLLESYLHEESIFLTLTYNDDHLPEGRTLVPDDLKNFWKRLRKELPVPIRYFACGEYGEKKGRPHYHALVFGIGPAFQPLIAKAWSLNGKSMGNIYIGTVTEHSCSYVAGYVTKKLTNKNDPYVKETLGDKHPEFIRISNGGGKSKVKGGLGASFMANVAEVLYRPGGSKYLALTGDVPSTLRQGGKDFPLGRYLRQKLRDEMLMPKIDYRSTPEGMMHVEKMRQMLTDSKAAGTSLREAWAKANAAKIEQAEARSRFYPKQRRILDDH